MKINEFIGVPSLPIFVNRTSLLRMKSNAFFAFYKKSKEREYLVRRESEIVLCSTHDDSLPLSEPASLVLDCTDPTACPT